MKKSFLLLAASLAVSSMMLAGCGNTQSSMTPQQQANFGHYGQAMPQAAKDAMAKARSSGPPNAGAPPAAKH